MMSHRASPNEQAVFRGTPESASGFTLTELMVVIALTGLLLAILVPVLASGERSARATEELNAARHLIRGYVASSEDDKGRLMVGYLSEDQNESDWEGNYDVLGPEGTLLQGPAKRRWTWRLLPYLDNTIEGKNTVLVGVRNEQGPRGHERGYHGEVPTLGIHLVHAVAMALDASVDDVVAHAGDARHGDGDLDPLV